MIKVIFSVLEFILYPYYMLFGFNDIEPLSFWILTVSQFVFIADIVSKFFIPIKKSVTDS